MSGTGLAAFPFRLPSPFLSRAATRLTPRAVHGLALCDPLRRVLVWFDVDPAVLPAPAVVARLREKGVLVSALGSQTIRACTHLNVSRADCETAAAAIRALAP